MGAKPNSKDPDSHAAPEQRGADPLLFRSLVGESACIDNVRSVIRRVASGDSTVLILGETGTGKEIVARNIHYRSARRERPFVAVNCGAIPPDLLESELFGHERGSFTGALTSRKGRFELADGGTLFLDEIGDMRLETQVNLLRALQERCFNRIGGTQSIEVDVRLISATHHDLESMIRLGSFREDLYYRLNVVPIAMPPLRDRRGDIPLLISELNSRLRARGLPARTVSEDALRALLAYDWPGNVRELANVMERCSNLVLGSRIEVKDLPVPIQAVAGRGAAASGETVLPGALVAALEQIDLDKAGIGNVLDSVEAHFIRRALDECNGVVSQAALRLGMRRSTLFDRIRKLGL